MRVRILFSLVLAPLFAAATALAAPHTLVGKWALGGVVLFEFKANGTGLTDGEPFRWRAKGQELVISAEGVDEPMGFVVEGDVLTLLVGGVPLQLQRVGAKSTAARPAATPPAAAPGHVEAPAATAPVKVPTKDKLAKLLLSSPWCTFRYNQTSGYSSSTRVVFYPDGTYQVGAQTEGYSSGYGGTMASQHHSGSTGQWTVKKGVMHASAPPEAPTLVPVALAHKKNSNGAPILVYQGAEYSQCR